MSNREYDPRPVFELIAEYLLDALNKKDWVKVEKIFKEVKKLAEKN